MRIVHPSSLHGYPLITLPTCRGYGSTSGGEHGTDVGGRGQPRQSALAGSVPNTTLPSSHYLASSAFLAFAASSNASSYLSSYLTSYLTSYPSSYLSSYDSFGTYIRSVTYFDGTTTTLPSAFGTHPPGQGAEGQPHGAQHYPGLPEFIFVRVPSPPFVPSCWECSHHVRVPPPAPAVVSFQADHLGGCVVHFYSSFYDAAHQWWLANEATIVKTLKA